MFCLSFVLSDPFFFIYFSFFFLFSSLLGHLVLFLAFGYFCVLLSHRSIYYDPIFYFVWICSFICHVSYDLVMELAFIVMLGILLLLIRSHDQLWSFLYCDFYLIKPFFWCCYFGHDSLMVWLFVFSCLSFIDLLSPWSIKNWFAFYFYFFLRFLLYDLSAFICFVVVWIKSLKFRL